MKKIIVLVLCIGLLLSLCACSGSNSAARSVMRYVDNKYKPQEFTCILSGESAQGFEALLTVSFYYNDDLTMYSAVEDNTCIAVFDLAREDVDLSNSSVTAGAMSAYGYRECGVDNQIFFTYSPKNIVLYAAHNCEDITANYK